MLTHEHAQTALEFLEKADRHFADDDQIQASEKLWGAAAHTVMAIAQERGYPHTSHPALKRAAEQLSAEQNDPLITANFGVAEKYQLDSHHLFMEAEEWTTDRPKVHDLVARVLALHGNNAGPGRNAQPGAAA